MYAKNFVIQFVLKGHCFNFVGGHIVNIAIVTHVISMMLSGCKTLNLIMALCTINCSNQALHPIANVLKYVHTAYEAELNILFFFFFFKMFTHRRRIKTEAKARIVAVVWGAELIKFLAALAFMHQDNLKKGMNSSYSS